MKEYRNGFKNKKQVIIASTLVFMLAVLVFFALFQKAAEKSQTVCEVFFSASPGFYAESVEVELRTDVAADIYYTLDGSEPVIGNSSTMKYNTGDRIVLECQTLERVYTIRAKAVSGLADDTMLAVNSATYVVGANVETRYDIPVLIVVGNSEDLTDEITGILATANREQRGAETEKPVWLTLFDATGEIIFAQNGGVRVHGGASRSKNQPSLRLYARSEYDTANEFDCVLFESYSKDNALMTDLKRVIVRNSGDDNGYAHIRSEFASALALNAGFPDAQASAPVCVYVNGEYLGVYWFVTNYDASYFTQKYGEYTGEMVMLEGVVALMQPTEDDDDITLQLKEEYNTLHEYVAYTNLQDDANWQALNAAIDVENYLQYVAIQNYFGNADAFVNNFKTYRYYSPTGDYQPDTVFDGRYRFLLYDMDETLGFGVYDDVAAEARTPDVTNRVSYDIFYNALFRNIVQRPEGREYFIRYYLSLLNYYCAPNQALPVLEKMHNSREQELKKVYNNTQLLTGNKNMPEEADYSQVEKELAEIEKYIQDRPAWALEDLETAFAINNRYKLEVHNAGEAQIQVDFASFHDQIYTGTYFSEIPVTVSVTPKCGDKFDYWLVDGVEYYDTTLRITSDMIQEETLKLECVTSRDEDAGLLISAIKSRGGSDYIELTNFGTRPVDLAEYMLADGEKPENMSTLPSAFVAPGEQIIVYCKNYSGAEAIGKPEAGFNLKTGETLFLYCGEVKQKVIVPRMGTRDGIYRIDVYSRNFFERVED